MDTINEKNVIALMIVLMTLGLAACGSGSKTPADTVDSFLNALKNKDSDTIESLYAGNNPYFATTDFALKAEAMQVTSDKKELEKYYEETFTPKLLDFDYEIGDEKVNGDTATVDVTFTTYNIGDTMVSYKKEHDKKFQKMFGTVKNPSDDVKMKDLQKKFDKEDSVLYKKSVDGMKKSYKGKATISLTKKDGAWVIDEFKDDDSFYNASIGGVIDANKEIENIEAK